MERELFSEARIGSQIQNEGGSRDVGEELDEPRVEVIVWVEHRGTTFRRDDEARDAAAQTSGRVG